MDHLNLTEFTPDAAEIVFMPKILYLTEDPALMRRQLEGHHLQTIPPGLADSVSTDEITPAWTCFWYDETLGVHSHVGFRNGTVQRGDLKRAGFEVIVSGFSRGSGSSRETAPFSERCAGVRLLIARSFEPIYRQNCHNIGLFTSTDFGLIQRVERGEAIPVEELVAGTDALSALTVRSGGLFALTERRRRGEIELPPVGSSVKPMTLAEKIIRNHASERSTHAVAPGDSLYCRADIRFTHDYVTAMAASLFHTAFGPHAKISGVDSVYAFRDHLTALAEIMPTARRHEGLLDLADNLATQQQSFCLRHGISLYDELKPGAAQAICHNAVLEDLALPNQIVIGTDSHTCTAGAVGCLALGVGATAMANAWFSGEVQLKVPETVLVKLTGHPPWETTAKDIMLRVMSSDYFASGDESGKILEFSGPTVEAMNIDERATLTNLAVEAGGLTGIVAADHTTTQYLRDARLQLDFNETPMQSDVDADFAHVLELDVSDLEPMVATPGDPRNGIPISELDRSVTVDIAYGGSCTGGKLSDIAFYAEVLEEALRRGYRVHPRVNLYLQFGSQSIKRKALRRGYLDIFREAGATLLEPACGACIRAGPGVSETGEQVTISAANRNYPGRSGPGQVYLASPRVVAASAIAGEIVRPSAIFS